MQSQRKVEHYRFFGKMFDSASWKTTSSMNAVICLIFLNKNIVPNLLDGDYTTGLISVPKAGHTYLVVYCSISTEFTLKKAGWKPYTSNKPIN